MDIYNTCCKAHEDSKEDCAVLSAVFCDVSKAFDRVWHKGLLFELKSAGINAILLQWFTDYLKENSESSYQGSILGHLFFFVFINGIVEEINSSIWHSANDTSLYIFIDDPLDSAI